MAAVEAINVDIVLYTDGACRGNPGPGGCAAIIDDGSSQTELARGYRWTTNNRMEIQSIIVALELIGTAASIRLISDSQYVLNTLSKGWIAGWKRKGWISSAREPVKNRDLWEKLDVLVARHAMTYQWVRGHATHALNNRCDEMAVAAAQGEALQIDAGYEAVSPFCGVPASAESTVVPVKMPFIAAGAHQAFLPGLS
jgi:ribonuclease HI